MGKLDSETYFRRKTPCYRVLIVGYRLSYICSVKASALELKKDLVKRFRTKVYIKKINYK